MDPKRCCHCRIKKPLDEFNLLTSSPDGHRRDCKACVKLYRDQHTDRQTTYMADYWQRTRDVQLAKKRENYFASDAHVHRLPEVERFWAHVAPAETPTGCLLWIGSCNPDGYGTFHRKPYVSAHRFAWAVAYGTIPDGLSVLHRCDTPPCVNVNHLFLGTQGDNMTDAAQKGRKAIKITASQVHTIRTLQQTHTASAVAQMFNISPGHVYDIWHNRRRKSY
mgnify:CR=1 FL=1